MENPGVLNWRTWSPVSKCACLGALAALTGTVVVQLVIFFGLAGDFSELATFIWWINILPAVMLEKATGPVLSGPELGKLNAFSLVFVLASNTILYACLGALLGFALKSAFKIIRVLSGK